MGRVVVMNHVTLDGVMQGPGRPDEDTRDGFVRGGWGAAAAEPFGAAMSERMTAGGGLAGWLFGRRTYDDLLDRWNREPDSPHTAGLNNTTKYVVSRQLDEPLRWPNSVLLRGDAEETVAGLKPRVDGVLAVMGSGVLIRSLLEAHLVDELLLMIHPVVLGSGRRLFVDPGPPADLRLLKAEPTPTGGVIVAYETSPGSR